MPIVAAGTLGAMPMREDCRHFASRLYDDGEAARFCVLDLAPEAPWRCPADCTSYERTAVDGTFEQGSFARRPEVESEPEEESAEAIQDLLDDAERIVDEAEPDVLRELDAAKPKRGLFGRRKKRRDDGDDDWHLSSR